MSFQLTRTHTSVVLAATTIAASLVVIPSLAEGNQASQDGFCAALTGAEPRITSEYNPLLASYAAGAAGASTPSATGSDRETELRDALDAAKASLAAAQQSAVNATASTVADNTTDVDTVSRALGWVDWSQVDDATQAKIIEVLVVQKMNAYRVNAGLPELVVSDTLTSDSRSWSQHMSDTDDFSHDPTWKYWNGVTLDGGETSFAGENIAYNYRENFGDKWGAYGTTKDPMQAANALFDQWKNSPGHDKNMLARNNVALVCTSPSMASSLVSTGLRNSMPSLAAELIPRASIRLAMQPRPTVSTARHSWQTIRITCLAWLDLVTNSVRTPGRIWSAPFLA